MRLRTALIACIFVIAAASACLSQATTVTATAQDSDGTTWAGGAYTVTYFSSTPGSPTEISTSGTFTTKFSGVLNGSGALSLNLVSSTNIWPTGSGWIFKVCPAITNAICYSTAPITITGASQSVSTQVNAVIVAPRVTGGIGVSAYNDVEVAAIPNNSYYNVTDGDLHCYGSAWAVCGEGGGDDGTVTSVSVVPANGVSGSVANPTTTPAITLTLGAITPTSTNGVSSATMAFMDATSSVQTQLNSKGVGTVTAVSVASANGVSGTSSGGATPAITIALGAITPTSTNGVSAATMAFMDATSSVQTQINGKQASLGFTPAHSGANSDITSLTGLTTPLTVAQGGIGAATAPANSVFGNFTGSTAAPGFAAAPTFSAANLTNFPTLNQNTTGSAATATTATTAANLSGTPALPNGTTATTQTTGDTTTKLATTAFVQTAVASGGIVASVFGRTGTVAATSGDYNVSQITGAAPLASPALSGTPTAPTASGGTSTTQLATTAFVQTATSALSISIPTGTATFAGGTGITSVVCATGYSCNNSRGTLTIVAAIGATTGTIATVTFSAALGAAPACFANQNGGATTFGIGNSAPTTGGFNITAGISVSLATLTVNYTCQL